jgi:acetyl-CoA acyltransferase
MHLGLHLILALQKLMIAKFFVTLWLSQRIFRPTVLGCGFRKVDRLDAFICDGVRTPIGRYGGALSSVRTDDLASLPLQALIARNPSMDPTAIDEVLFGSANQAGEDNRNVARMALLLAGLPETVPGVTLNRLCASGMDAVGFAARGIKAGDYDLTIAGGVESMSRAPFVMPKATSAFTRMNEVFDTTIGWRFVNPKMKAQFGVDSMPQTADNVAAEYNINRLDQDAMAARSQANWAAAQDAGLFGDEIAPVTLPQRKGDPIVFDTDEHPRPGTGVDRLGKLKGVNGPDLTVTAGNASGVNDGAAALLIASQHAARAQGLTPMARILGMASTGVAPRVMGIGPAPASAKLLARLGLAIEQMDVIELNEAFAAQGLATLRALGVADDDPRVNPQGGAIAIGHPLGMTGARLVLTAAHQLKRTGGRYALCTMCVGVGQGTALILERV